jgi:hypothetical protein
MVIQMVIWININAGANGHQKIVRVCASNIVGNMAKQVMGAAVRGCV